MSAAFRLTDGKNASSLRKTHYKMPTLSTV